MLTFLSSELTFLSSKLTFFRGVTPIVLIFSWLLGTSGWLDCCGKMEPTLVMLISCGLSVCGT